ncbi:DUF951 domain-containing protein [Halarsenatibacter silvermanii]|uniref:DUF951 domain-containing protein n=1 Tax=Halarsenatibacter silvermanii TaxID=321763 RepID=A0A1G9Q481_9FIRM|nr:DUF951 domain-containing protein [Halarsenatibacter silvermanii]SDM05844.1 hypothetical protein SAMN04488692_11543 [Halarsenatibacter silvermanii]
MNSADVKPEDIVKMKKPHPCGANRWRVIRVGMDFKLRCCECDRFVRMKRKKFEKSFAEILEKAEE